MKLTFDPKKIQKKFKHAIDFDPNLTEWSPENGSAFQDALLRHVNNQSAKKFDGTYRKTTVGVHNYNPETQNWAFFEDGLIFVTGFKLGVEQIRCLRENGNIQ